LKIPLIKVARRDRIKGDSHDNRTDYFSNH
jgi:hypothetical protein